MKKNSVVLYKNSVAIVQDIADDKFTIKYLQQPATSTGKKAVYGEQKVRQKDIVLLHIGPFSSEEKVLYSNQETLDNSEFFKKFTNQLTEVYELLTSDEQTSLQPLSLQEISEYAINEFLPDTSFLIFRALINDPHFEFLQDELKNGDILFRLRSSEEIQKIAQKKYEKEHEEEIKQAFYTRLKQKQLDLPNDAKFMGEVEAYALCKTDKSKVLIEAKLGQSLEKAHKLLIDTKIWDFTKNPYPTRLGFSFESAKLQLGAMPKEERLVLPTISYAIDGEHSLDPDDSVCFDGKYLWVHVADPASSVLPDSNIDIAARERGTTLYIPEGTSRMLCESCLEDYALGLKEESNALSFRILVDQESQITECEVFKTTIKVKRLTYKQAEEQKDSPELKPLFEIARKNKERRENNNATTIQMPEVSIEVDKETKKVTITEEQRYESNDMVAELMIMAGEGAARFAFKNQIPFPFVSQEKPSFPDKVPNGLAGQFAKILCMKKRSVGITPSPHAGLGVSFYSQVTSPLRRYSDLIAHQQLRAFIDKRKTLNKDEMLERVSAGDIASLNARKASKLSNTHWKLVYLLQNPENEYQGVCIDKRGNDALFLIPSLDMQTTIKNRSEVELNSTLTLKMTSVDIPTQQVTFTVIS